MNIKGEFTLGSLEPQKMKAVKWISWERGLTMTLFVSFQMAYILYYMAIVGHALSIVSLLISLAIFFYFRWVSISSWLSPPLRVVEGQKYLLRSCSYFNKPLDDGSLSCSLVFGRAVCCLLSNITQSCSRWRCGGRVLRWRLRFI